MSQPQTVLAHLLEGRDELVREVQRLTTAIAELDAVIERVGGAASSGDRHPSASAPSARPARGRAPAAAEPWSGPARGPGAPAVRAAASAGDPRDRPAGASGAAAGGPGPKSIRVHVLEMLAAETARLRPGRDHRAHPRCRHRRARRRRPLDHDQADEGRPGRAGRPRASTGSPPARTRRRRRGRPGRCRRAREPGVPARRPHAGIAPALNLGEHWRPAGPVTRPPVSRAVDRTRRTAGSAQTAASSRDRVLGGLPRHPVLGAQDRDRGHLPLVGGTGQHGHPGPDVDLGALQHGAGQHRELPPARRAPPHPPCGRRARARPPGDAVARAHVAAAPRGPAVRAGRRRAAPPQLLEQQRTPPRSRRRHRRPAPRTQRPKPPFSGSERSGLSSSSMLTSLNVTTRTVFTKRAGRYMSHTQASRMVSSK